ncbi:trigger factor [Ancylobacter sp. MQZ15Z-1]|uniref:Trigger factor n=1 Tax=Ancylobacter mangrovi TaxID=2972472 RepID=A0A9X2T2Q4_9HYPH|nr:trigger factor [Ancylobacter mangrovi]MCS0496102.1 trigger factor [Ancylobacter mangrovi]
MQVTELLAEGLKREYRVVLPAAELDAKANERLNEMKDKVRLNGFRPGKVPVAHLKRMYGKSVLAEVIDQAVNEANGQIVEEHGFKLALQPKIELPQDEGAVNEVLEGKADLSYTVGLEVLPSIELGDFKSIELDKPVLAVTDAEVDEMVNRIAEGNRPYSAKEGAAENGDRVTVAFVGTIDGEKFEGGSGEDIPVVIGSNTFIPGFEEQLVGIKADETRTVNVTFPENYQAANLAGKAASFEVTAKTIEAPGEVKLDDEFAKTLGMDSLDALKEQVKSRIAQEHNAQSRAKVKRKLLDVLDTMHQFDVPPTLAEQEFEGIWGSVTSEMEQQKRTFEDEGTTQEAARADYETIAKRRVRLGLVLAEIGEKNDIQVSDDEVTRAVVERARQFPGQEQQVWEFYRKNAQALASLRAPIFEEKVVDFLLELAKVKEVPVTREELYAEDEADKAEAGKDEAEKA